MDGMMEQFGRFCQFGATGPQATSAAGVITLSNLDKWFKQAKVFDDKRITTTDTAIHFKKICKTNKMNYNELLIFLDDMCTTKKVDVESVKRKLGSTGGPGTSNTTKTMHIGGVDRLTDTSKYTGSHKSRFDEWGQGRGLSGREDIHENTGYVKQYKGKDTYDGTH